VPVLPGRHAESELLDEAIRCARTGLRVVVLDGPAGVGKSALIEEALESARAALPDDPHRVLRASGDPDERHVTFGVLDQLFGPPADGGYGELAAPHARAADLVRRLGSDATPTVVVIEDAQWSDDASLSAVAYALRRLHDAPVALLLSTRTTSCLPTGLLRLARSPVGQVVPILGLDTVAARAAADAWGFRTSGEVLARLVEHTGGNPLHLRLVLSSTPTVDLLDPADAPPAVLGVDEIVTTRLDGLPRAGRGLVEAAAVAGVATPLNLLGTVTDLGKPAAALQAACDAGLAETRTTAAGVVVVLDHSTRAAVYHHLAADRRASLHAAVADQLPDPSASLRHRLAAAGRLDVDLAGEADRLADLAVDRGDWTATATWELAIARCAPDPADRAHAARRAAHSLVVAGDTIAAAAVLDDAGVAPEPSPAAALVRGRIAASRGELGDAEALLATAYELGDAVAAGAPPSTSFGRAREPDVRGAAASHLAAIHFARARGDDALRWARIAVEVGAEGLGRTDVDPISRLLLSSVLAGRIDDAAAPRVATTPGDPRTDGTLGRSVVAAVTGHPAEAEVDLAALARRARAEGPLSLWAFTQCWRSAIAFGAGDWDAATEHAGVAAIVTEHDGWSFAAAAHCCLATVLAARGQTEALRTSLGDARSTVDAAGSPELLEHLLAATLAWVDWLDGDHAAVLERTAALPPAIVGVPLLALPPMALLQALSAMRCGDVELAATSSARLPAWGPWPAWSEALAGLAATVAGEGERGVGRMESALRRLDGGPHVLDEVVLRVELGSARRRLGQRGPATDELRTAAAVLDRLGAAPLLSRVEAEVSLLGATRVRRRSDPGSLTPAELVVGTLASEGRSNREIAAELVLSVKTVEFHLTNVFRKVGVRNRTELARRGLG
jgi:DNA-binding CsgD family transcriptional regulator